VSAHLLASLETKTGFVDSLRPGRMPRDQATVPSRNQMVSRKGLLMAEATCRRELELEIPAEEVTKRWKAWRRNRAAGERAGIPARQAPVSLIRRKFAEDIKGEVLESLVPERVRKRWRTETDAGVAATSGQAGFQRGAATEVSRGV